MFSARTTFTHPRTLLIALTVILLAAALVVLPRLSNDKAKPTAANPVTPGTYTGLGFDQCQAPRQSYMDTWLTKSPFRAAGIYITGDERGCRTQTYLNSTWVATQLAKGWHLLPIDFGPQASCNSRFPRYSGDFTISASTTSDYAKARAQGTAEATKAVADASALGIVAGSTLFYDLEAFTYSDTACRESALRFVSNWSAQVKALGYRAGFYSSAGSGIKMIEAARVNATAGITLPDALWLARYDGAANTSATAYLSDAGWQGNRVKQYQGGHNETYGGVTINIDRDYLNLTSSTPSTVASPPVVAAETHCGGVKVNLATYRLVRKRTSTYHPKASQVRALTCLLRERTSYAGPVSSTYGKKTQAYVRRWRAHRQMKVNTVWTSKQWMWLLAKGSKDTLTTASTGTRVRDVQRALNAAYPALTLPITGYFSAATISTLATWRARVGLPASSTVATAEWVALKKGKR